MRHGRTYLIALTGLAAVPAKEHVCDLRLLHSSPEWPKAKLAELVDQCRLTATGRGGRVARQLSRVTCQRRLSGGRWMTCSSVWKLFSNGLTLLSRRVAARQLRMWPRMHRRPHSSSSSSSSSQAAAAHAATRVEPYYRPEMVNGFLIQPSDATSGLANPWPRPFLRRRVCHAPLAAAQRSMGQQLMFMDTHRICRAGIPPRPGRPLRRQ